MIRGLPKRAVAFSFLLIGATQAAAQTTPDSVVLENYMQCNFSRFRSWGGELERLLGEKMAAERSYNFAKRQLADAKSDLEKQAYLSSQQINEARSAISMWQPMAERKLISYVVSDWCIKCAEKRPENWQQCK